MTLTEYINTMAFGIIYGLGSNAIECTRMSMEKTYNSKYFYLPRVYCKDGFSVSIQVDRGHYCGSENGIRTFGIDWKRVEWGYPSQSVTINGTTIVEDCDYAPIEVMEEVIEEHGGIDLQTTLQKKMDVLSKLR